MIIKIKKNWIFLTGVKFKRENLIVDSDKFVQFWALASGIFPNTSLIVSNFRILMIFTISDRNLQSLQSESVILFKKLNNLVVSMLSGHTGFKLDKLVSEDISFIKTSSFNYNNPRRGENDVYNIQSDVNDSSPTLISIRKILPHVILQEDGYYKIMILFENLKFNTNLRITFLALIQLGTYIIIGSRQYGKFKSILLEIIDKDNSILRDRYQDLINICNQSNQFSGKLSIVDPKLLDKNLLKYSLGLFANSNTPHNLIEIITKLPELLSIKQ